MEALSNYQMPVVEIVCSKLDIPDANGWLSQIVALDQTIPDQKQFLKALVEYGKQVPNLVRAAYWPECNKGPDGEYTQKTGRFLVRLSCKELNSLTSPEGVALIKPPRLGRGSKVQPTVNVVASPNGWINIYLNEEKIVDIVLPKTQGARADAPKLLDDDDDIPF